MAAIQSSDDMRLIADERADEARALLAASHYSGAYYLAGYAVECALKAVITKDLSEWTMPDWRALQSAHIHDLQRLATLAGLDSALAGDPVTGPSWLTAKSWSETSRYRLVAAQEAMDLVEAVTHPTQGVLVWLKQHW